MAAPFIPDPTPGSDAVREAAALWHDRLNGGSGGAGSGTEAVASETDREAFVRWMAESPSHREAHAAIERAWQMALEQAQHPQILALRQEAALRLTRRSVRRRPIWTRALAAGVAFLAFGSLGLSAWRFYDPDMPMQSIAAVPMRLYEQLRGIDHYRTAIGERLNIVLGDGSLVTLNTHTELRVAFAADERKVELVRGQALFEVAKDAARPFVVEAGNRRFTAVGTAFDVRVDSMRLQVTMLEGKVKVEPPAALAQRPPEADSRAYDEARVHLQQAASATSHSDDIVLSAGQQLVTVAALGTDNIQPTDAERVASWRNGQVVFEDTPLVDAVAELNRYTRTPIRLAPALAEVRISGAFMTGRPEVFVEAVTAYFPVEARRTPDAIHLSRRR